MDAILTPGIEDGHDTRVLQLRGGLRFVEEALNVVLANKTRSANCLQRHEAFRMQLPRLEHHSHAAAAQFLEQFVARENAAAGER